jgi:Protein of unknown function (DUF2911)
VRCYLLVLLGAFAATPAALKAQSTVTDTAGFVSTLGADTVAVERFVQTHDSVYGEAIARSPTTRRLVYSARFDRDGYVKSYTLMRLTSATDAKSPPALRLTVDFRNDSVYLTDRHGDSTTTQTLPAPRNTIPTAEPTFGLIEVMAERGFAAHGSPAPFALYYPGGTADPATAISRANSRCCPMSDGSDSVWIESATDTIRAKVDAHGRLLGAADPGGTFQAVVTRISPPDLDRWAADYSARDASGKALGALSPRDTARGTAGRAHILVDYGRPTKRGRVIFGNVVPWNTVWRTGANAATTLVVDHDVLLGTTHLPAGTYTVFSVPAPTSWMLVVSRKTGEWGTEYDSTADFARIPMRTATSSTPIERFTIGIEPKGSGAAVLTFSWDKVVARLPIRSGDKG